MREILPSVYKVISGAQKPKERAHGTLQPYCTSVFWKRKQTCHTSGKKDTKNFSQKKPLRASEVLRKE